MQDKLYSVYILMNKNNTTLYTGFCGKPLKARIWEHKQKPAPGFTKKYNISKLVYYETYHDAYSAITREKQIKAGSRQKKLDLINQVNSQWKDLYYEL